MLPMRALIAAVLLTASGAAAVPQADTEAAAVFSTAAHGDYDAAIRAANAALRRPGISRKQRAELIAVRAYASMAQGRMKAAQYDFDDAIHLSPDASTRDAVRQLAADAYDDRAGKEDDQGNWDLSIAYYTKELEYRPDNPATLRARAMAHRLNCEFDEAIADYDRAFAIGKPYVEDFIDRSVAHELKLDFDGALADLNSAIKLDPSDYRLYGFRGHVLAEQGRYEAARADFEHTLKIEPRDLSTLVWLHITHLKLGQDDGAWLKTKAAAADSKPWPGPALAFFAGVLSERDLIHLALVSSQTRIEHQRCDGWFYAGEAALAQGMKKHAEELFQKTVDGCNPNDYEWVPAKMELRRLRGRPGT
ncbi:MAG: tetratricopeptide repeat protein [Alphaproteobacteria bacterium]|nr:tetratricopeptide repeat protein [Alphaproteobacteria bacterium]